LTERPDQAAIIWEGDDPGNQKMVTYRELHDQVCRLANAMRGLGIRRGDGAILDAVRQAVRGEAAEHHGMDGAQSQLPQ
jgi:acyl-coenzyme A synthetase/AMP-(fatty) acid ligase